MNRCIQCYRCVRFYRDYAGGRDFEAFLMRNHVYFGRQTDGTLQSEFSGNLTEVCPTGVFDDKTFMRHYTRKWDLQTAPSVCVHCGLGCNIIPGERYGTLRRIRNRFNGEVNGYFLCDRGRYGYEFVNSDRRIREPLLAEPVEGSGDRKSDGKEVSKEVARQHLASLLYYGAKVIGIGSPRASLEANFALRTLVGPANFYQGISRRDVHLISLIVGILRQGPARSPSLREVEQCDAVLVLGEDITNVAPMLDLALRQAVRRMPIERIARKWKIPEWDDAPVREALQEEKGPLFLATPYNSKLEDVATRAFHGAPDDLARLGFAVAHALNKNAPSVPRLAEEMGSLAMEIALALKGAKKPLVISGTSSASEGLIQAAANVAWALCQIGSPAQLCFTVPECNSLGLGLLGGDGLEAAFEEVEEGRADVVIILENDLYRRASAPSVTAFLNAARHLIVLDHLTGPITAKAEVVLPAATFAEAGGTLVNNEGRAQRFFPVFLPEGPVQESWRWLLDMMRLARRPEGEQWQIIDHIIRALSEDIPILEPVRDIAPPAGFRVAGLKIPRQPQRYSGRTAMHAHLSVHEPQPPEDPDSPLSFSMEGYGGKPPAPLIPRFWTPGWNSVQAVNKFQSEVAGPLIGGDPGRRLIEPGKMEKTSFFPEVPDGFEPRSGEWLVIPRYHIFGSEELSILSPGIAKLAPGPYIGMNPEDAAILRVGEGETVRLSVEGMERVLPLKYAPSLPVGIILLPCGLPGWEWIRLPAWGKLLPRKTEEPGT
jgi:NADH-quinone oxidoreductase subunit G